VKEKRLSVIRLLGAYRNKNPAARIASHPFEHDAFTSSDVVYRLSIFPVQLLSPGSRGLPADALLRAPLGAINEAAPGQSLHSGPATGGAARCRLSA